MNTTPIVVVGTLHVLLPMPEGVRNPHIKLCHFFRTVNLVIFGIKASIDTGYLVNTTPPTVLVGSFSNFACVFVKV